MRETCLLCGSTSVRLVQEMRESSWDIHNRSGHGPQTFVLADEFYHCDGCGEDWYDLPLARRHEAVLNEAIKAKTGYDWLAAGEARRARRRAS